MTADQLYTALTKSPKGVTADRLARANQRADSTDAYQQLIARLTAEGKMPA